MGSNELIEKIIYTSNKEKFLNKREIRQVVKHALIFAEEEIRKNYAGTKFVRDKERTNMMAWTYIDDGLINADLNNLYCLCDKKIKKNNFSYLACNLEIAQAFLHEVEHLREPAKKEVNQLNKFLIDHGSIEFLDTLESIEDDADLNELYNSIWSIVPCEKIAEVDSYIKLIEKLYKYPNFSEKYASEFEIVKENYLNAILKGYEKGGISSSFMLYLKKIGRVDLLIDFGVCVCKYMDVTKLSIHDTLKYGLPIESKDINKYKRLVKKL